MSEGRRPASPVWPRLPHASVLALGLAGVPATIGCASPAPPRVPPAAWGVPEEAARPAAPITTERPPSAAPGGEPLPARATCPRGYGSARETGRLGHPAIVEASGVAASLRDPGVLWIHNDSGDVARLFAVGTDGRAIAELHLEGVTAIDFEDVAAAPCPDGSGPCLWVADTGDNAHQRRDAAVYVVPEPDLRGSPPGAVLRVAPRVRVPIVWPGAPVDAEALLVSPRLDALYLFEKVNGPRARLFRRRAPFTAERRPMEEVAVFDSPGFPIRLGRMITGAGMHPSGERFLLRVYTGVYEYRLGPGRTPADIAAVDPLRVTLGPLSEPQGEAVGYDAAGTGVWTVSEDPRGRPGQPLHHYDCD